MRLPEFVWRWYVRARRRALVVVLPDLGEVIHLFGNLYIVVWHYPVTVALSERRADGQLIHLTAWAPDRYLTPDRYIEIGKAPAAERTTP